MKIFLDTANIDDIRTAAKLGVVAGITTNPSLLAKEGGDPHEAMEEITQIIRGDVSLEVVSTNYDGMVEEGKKLTMLDKAIGGMTLTDVINRSVTGYEEE